MRVFLEGVLCEAGADAQYIECGQKGTESTYIRWNDDIPPCFEIRIEVPIRAYEPSRYADNELVDAVAALKDRVAALEEPVFCTKFDSPANTRSSSISPDTIYVLPAEYTVAADQLQVYIDGILQYVGKDYVESGVPGSLSTDIKFLKNVPITANIRVYISIRNGEKYTVLNEAISLEAMHRYILARISKEAREDVTTSEIIVARAEYTVPSYIVGNNSLKVYKNGILMINGRDYSEDTDEGVVSTNIFWHSDVPEGTLISVITPVLE